MKLHVFVHLVNLPGSMFIAKEMIDSLVKSDLVNNADFSIYCNYGYQEFDWLREQTNSCANIKLFYPTFGPDKNFEIPTLIELKKFCDSASDEYGILYIHQKGATNPNDLNRQSRRHQMINDNIYNWKHMVGRLEQGFDTAGSNLLKSVTTNYIYEGNWWWARSSYIKNLDKLQLPSDVNYRSQLLSDLNFIPNLYRFDAEHWIFTKSPIYYNFVDNK